MANPEKQARPFAQTITRELLDMIHRARHLPYPILTPATRAPPSSAKDVKDF